MIQVGATQADLIDENAAPDGSASPLAVGGGLLALGSLGVTITSLFYALSPPAAALPAKPFDQASALAGAIDFFWNRDTRPPRSSTCCWAAQKS